VMYAAYGGFLGCDIRNVGVCEGSCEQLRDILAVMLYVVVYSVLSMLSGSKIGLKDHTC